MRSKLDALLPDILERYRKGELDHVRVAEFLARYGLGQKDEVSVVSPEVKRRLQLQVEVIGSRTEWRTEELLQQIETIWTSNPTNK